MNCHPMPVVIDALEPFDIAMALGQDPGERSELSVFWVDMTGRVYHQLVKEHQTGREIEARIPLLAVRHAPIHHRGPLLFSPTRARTVLTALRGGWRAWLADRKFPRVVGAVVD